MITDKTLKLGHQNRPDAMRDRADKIVASMAMDSDIPKYKKGGKVKQAACKKYAAGGAAKIRLDQYSTSTKKKK